MPTLRGTCTAMILIAAVMVTAEDRLTHKHKRVVKAQRSTTSTHRRTSTFQSMGQVSASDLAQALVGSTDTLLISNAEYVGAETASGIINLTGSGHYLEGSLSRALVLTTGDATTTLDTTNDFKDSTTSLDTPGRDAIGANSYDAAELHFTITPSTDGSISWQYVFASEEYPEYVNSRFNDAFRFMVDSTDVAVLPDSSIVVSINNVNSAVNSQYFIDNQNKSLATEYDGLTRLLTTLPVTVKAGSSHNITLVIADVSDTDYDSAVYIKAGSLVLQP